MTDRQYKGALMVQATVECLHIWDLMMDDITFQQSTGSACLEAH